MWVASMFASPSSPSGPPTSRSRGDRCLRTTDVDRGSIAALAAVASRVQPRVRGVGSPRFPRAGSENTGSAIALILRRYRARTDRWWSPSGSRGCPSPPVRPLGRRGGEPPRVGVSPQVDRGGRRRRGNRDSLVTTCESAACWTADTSCASSMTRLRIRDRYVRRTRSRCEPSTERSGSGGPIARQTCRSTRPRGGDVRVRDRTVLPNCGPVTGPVRRRTVQKSSMRASPRRTARGRRRAGALGRADHRLPDSFAGSLASVFVTVGKSLDGSHDIVERSGFPPGYAESRVCSSSDRNASVEASIAAVRQRVRQHFVDALVVLAVRIRGFEVAEPPGVLRVVSGDSTRSSRGGPVSKRVVPDRRHLVETDIAREFPEYLAQESIDGARVRGPVARAVGGIVALPQRCRPRWGRGRVRRSPATDRRSPGRCRPPRRG